MSAIWALTQSTDSLMICLQWNDREYTKDEWIHNNGNIEAGKLHDGTEIAVSGVLLLGISLGAEPEAV